MYVYRVGAWSLSGGLHKEIDHYGINNHGNTRMRNVVNPQAQLLSSVLVMLPMIASFHAEVCSSGHLQGDMPIQSTTRIPVYMPGAGIEIRQICSDS